MEKKFEVLYESLMTAIVDMPEEDECSDEENDVYDECMNLKEALERLKDCKG